MDRPRDYHTKQSQKGEDKSDDITYMWSLNYDTNDLIYKVETHSQTSRTNRLRVSKAEPGSRREELGVWG